MRKFLLTACSALTAAAILGLPSWARDDACLYRTVSLTAADRELAPIPDLKPEDFRGEFRGKPVKIRSIVADERPHRIVIILDASGSIGPPPPTTPGRSAWSLERQLASHLVEIRPRETTFALLIFNDKVITSTDIRRRLAASNSRVFVSLMVSSAGNRNRTPEELNGPEEMSKIAHATGGAIFGPVAQGSSGPVLLVTDSNQNLTISSGLRNFYKTMLGGYRIEIELPSPVDKWREWKLELTKEKQKQFKDSQLGYTRDLEPCTELPK